MQSVSVLKFGYENTLFVGDSRAGKIFAFSIDKTHNTSAEVIYNVKDADTKIAALLATTPDKILVKDIAVNPVSREVYIGVIVFLENLYPGYRYYEPYRCCTKV